MFAHNHNVIGIFVGCHGRVAVHVRFEFSESFSLFVLKFFGSANRSINDLGFGVKRSIAIAPGPILRQRTSGKRLAVSSQIGFDGIIFFKLEMTVTTSASQPGSALGSHLALRAGGGRQRKLEIHNTDGFIAFFHEGTLCF